MHESEDAIEDRDEAIAWGFDLFNHGFYWEAHEAWELAWMAENRKGETADLLKGLIKLAAAGVKAREGKPEGVRRHARRAGELFRSSGICPESCRVWARHAEGVASSADGLIDPRAENVVAVFDFRLAMPDLPACGFIDKSS